MAPQRTPQPTQFTPVFKTSYLCLSADATQNLCLGVSADGEATNSTLFAQIKQRGANVANGKDFFDLRFNINSSAETVCVAATPWNCFASGPRASPSVGGFLQMGLMLSSAVAFNTAPFFEVRGASAQLVHLETGLCATAMQCDSLPKPNLKTQTFCKRPGVQGAPVKPAYSLEQVSRGSFVMLTACSSSLSASQMWTQQLDCAPGCSTREQQTLKPCFPECNNAACSYQNYACTSESPSGSPSKTPTPPTFSPTWLPSQAPSESPSQQPTSTPTNQPSEHPSQAPSSSPSTSEPSATPTTSRPSKSPSRAPSRAPSKSPSRTPSSSPSRAPTVNVTQGLHILVVDTIQCTWWLCYLIPILVGLLLLCCCAACCVAWWAVRSRRRARDEAEKLKKQKEKEERRNQDWLLHPEVPLRYVHADLTDAFVDCETRSHSPAPESQAREETQDGPPPVASPPPTTPTPPVQAAQEPDPRPPFWDEFLAELKTVITFGFTFHQKPVPQQESQTIRGEDYWTPEGMTVDEKKRLAAQRSEESKLART